MNSLVYVMLTLAIAVVIWGVGSFIDIEYSILTILRYKLFIRHLKRNGFISLRWDIAYPSDFYHYDWWYQTSTGVVVFIHATKGKTWFTHEYYPLAECPNAAVQAMIYDIKFNEALND